MTATDYDKLFNCLERDYYVIDDLKDIAEHTSIDCQDLENVLYTYALKYMPQIEFEPLYSRPIWDNLEELYDGAASDQRLYIVPNGDPNYEKIQDSDLPFTYNYETGSIIFISTLDPWTIILNYDK